MAEVARTVQQPALDHPALDHPALDHPALGRPALGRPALGRPALSRELIDKIAPVTLAGQHCFDVPDALQPLFPWGGLQRGTSLAVAGAGGWSLAMATMATALGDEGWMAVVGVPDLGLAAAAELGLRLDRVLVVETPSVSQWPTVVAALLESVQVVAIAPGDRVGPRDGRRLAARAREQESVLLHLDGGRTWPTKTDVTLTVSSSQWEGLGEGHGHVRCRRATITSTGRRGAGAGGSIDVLLPGPTGKLEVAPVEADVLPFPDALPHDLTTTRPQTPRSDPAALPMTAAQ